MNVRKIALVAFSILGLGLNLLLLWWKLTDPSAGIAGCGGAAGCNEVLASKWSQVFGLPITVFGVFLYSLILYSILRPCFIRLLAPCLATLAGSVVWFVGVQIWILHHLCPWCLAAHVIGVIVVILGFMQAQRPFDRSVIAGVLANGLMIVSQVFGPAPTTHRIEETSSTIISAPIHARGDGRKIEFNNGTKLYDRDALPSIGSTKAPHVLVEYFDYRCAACRMMHGFLDSLIEKHPDQIAVLMLPLKGADQQELTGNTSLARIALAVWRTDPAKFPAIHRAFFAFPTPDDAAGMQLAASLISQERLDTALKDPWIDELLAANAEDRISFSNKTPQLPKLLVKGTRLLHGLPSGEADFIRVMEQELGL